MKKLVGALAIAAVAVGSVPAGANGPQITDPAHDANGLPVSQDTGPASYDPGDILSVTAETEHVAVPVGADGIDYRATGLVLRFQTLGVPVADVGTLAFGVHANLGDCSSSFVGYIPGEITPINEPHVGKVRWVQFGDCPNRSSLQDMGMGTSADDPSWTATANEAAHSVTLRIPFSELSPVQSEVLRPGAKLESPSAMSFFSRTVYIFSDAGASAKVAGIDATATGSDFVIGSDVPEDVPCTRDCP